ncbi:S41 family peptidase [Paenibacillus sp. CAU 1782]
MNNYDADIQKQRSGIWYAIGAVALLLAGFILGMLFGGARYPITKEPEFKQLSNAYNRILNDYLDGATPTQLINGAAQGMAASLEDPYSQYLAGEKGAQYTQSYEGQVYGIGAEIRQEESLFIIQSVFKDTPAERGGLLPGDIINSVDGVALQGKSLQDLLGFIRGEEGEPVTLSIQRGSSSEPIEMTLNRAAIPIHTVTSEMLEDGIGHVTITRFGHNTATEFKEELAKLKETGELKSLLLDLRSNPGGLLDATQEIASVIIPKGKKILDIVYKDERKVVSLVSKQAEEWKLPVVVLVNEYSASASEVLSSALQESAGIKIVGVQTFGKGVVQQFFSYPDQSVLILTEAQWKTPGGAWINKEGVTPDYPVELPAYASLRPLPLGAKLATGSYGDDVSTLQAMLQALGYEATGLEGLFDEATKAALTKFQSDEGLTATGVFNDKTGYRLTELLREKLGRDDTQLQKGVELLKAATQ